jgi:hypothetical protein
MPALATIPHSARNHNQPVGSEPDGPERGVGARQGPRSFWCQSSAAQVAVVQTKITDSGTFSFGPQGRIQRLLVPLPPAPPATASQVFSTPNVLVRCNGTSSFTKVLSEITNGFFAGDSSVNLYTGGQEAVVAEVVGGSKLKVGPAPGTELGARANWLVSVEVFLVRANPVGRYVVLRSPQVDLARANQLMQPLFQIVLDASAPNRRGIRLGPKILQIFRSAQARSD